MYKQKWFVHHSQKENEQEVIISHPQMGSTATARKVLEMSIETMQKICGDPSYTARIEITGMEYRAYAKTWRVHTKREYTYTADAILRGFPTQPQHYRLDLIVHSKRGVLMTAMGRL